MRSRLSRCFAAFLKNDGGLTAAEYACVLAIIMIASIVSVTILCANVATTKTPAETEILAR
jgi:Flp pilus assembly pilin Flp